MKDLKRMQRLAGILKENVQSKVEDVSLEMYRDEIYQSWVNDMWQYLEKHKPGFTEQDALNLLKDAQASLADVVDDNIQTYFKPDTL